MTQKNDRDQVYVAEEIYEVRYEPRGSFLTQIGDIADYIKDQGIFPHWQIEADRIRFFQSDQRNENHLNASMSYRNLAFVSRDSPTRNFFSDKGVKFWKAVEHNPHFKIPPVERIGVRSRYFARINKEFEVIERVMFDFFCNSNFEKIFGAQRTDHQIVLNLSNGEKKINATLGPLHKGEAKRLFQFKSEHFESAGVFIDFDYFVENPKKGINAVEEFIKEAGSSAWSQMEKIILSMGI